MRCAPLRCIALRSVALRSVATALLHAIEIAVGIVVGIIREEVRRAAVAAIVVCIVAVGVAAAVFRWPVLLPKGVRLCLRELAGPTVFPVDNVPEPLLVVPSGKD